MMRHETPYLSHTARRQEPPLLDSGSKRRDRLPPRRSLRSFLGQVGRAAVAGSLRSVATAFLDLDRTLLRGASGPAINRALLAEGVLSSVPPGQGALYGFFDRFGETLLSMGLARSAARVARGYDAEAVRRAGVAAVPELLEHVAPRAPERLAELRAAGCRLVLATTTPVDLVEPLARALGLDDVVATTYEVDDEGRYTGRIVGGFVWGLGKLGAVRRWAAEHGEDLDEAHAFSDSFFDVPLLSSVGHPHAVNADVRLAAVAALRGWPRESWDRSDGVPAIFGLEAYDVLRHLVRPEMFPYARFSLEGLEHLPSSGPALLCANHRSYFDVAALAQVAARLGRPVRALAKAELFDAPVVSLLARALGAIRVDRAVDPAEAYREALCALTAGEVVIVLPQGTIPRGESFFDPHLRGKTGAARLAAAADVPVVPIGVWGTEQVWPRSSRLPHMLSVLEPPTVTVRVGPPLRVDGADAEADTGRIMAAIEALVPEARERTAPPSPEELARTYPPGRANGDHSGDEA
jgi:putative phosphoserine phosphatase / 1-acylglycerol-3-phosphate O-acyltransferase